MNKYGIRYFQIILPLFLLVFSLHGQHRGDNLAFQGLSANNDVGIQAMAMGGAYTSLSGDLTSLFINPAGIADLSSFQISVGGNFSSHEMWENQVYRSNRLYVTLPFYLEGLYVPDPANNGMIDSDLALDSAYVVNPPEMGKVPSSKDAAEWSRKQDGGGFSSLALAYPLELAGQKFVLAGAYSLSNDIYNFDRNDTFLDPHIGSSVYDGFVERQDGSDTLNVNWYKYQRLREGQMHNAKFALAYQFNGNLHLSAGLNYGFGESTDELQMNKVGYFGMIDENEFFFSYDTLNTLIKGDSKYSKINFELGLQYKFGALSLGILAVTPSTMKREWDYTTAKTDTAGTISYKSSGTDELSLPAKFNLGLSFNPAKAFTFSLDYGFINYSAASFDLASQDTTHRGWKDQHALRFGIKVEPTNFLSLMAGYRTVTQVFVADGAAYDGRGPDATSWTMGLSLAVFDFGRIDMAYEMRSMSYYDEYYSNTNYATEKFNNFAVGYTYKF